jgi:hypothetical protein
VGFNGYPHGILNNSNEFFTNDYSSSSSLGLVLLDTNQFDVQNPLILRGIE